MTDRAKRPIMFMDFRKNKEDISKVAMLHKRRVVQQRISENVFRPKTHQQLLAKFLDDEAYVAKIEEDAKKGKRVQKDKFMLGWIDR